MKETFELLAFLEYQILFIVITLNNLFLQSRAVLLRREAPIVIEVRLYYFRRNIWTQIIYMNIRLFTGIYFSSHESFKLYQKDQIFINGQQNVSTRFQTDLAFKHLVRFKS